MAEGTLKPTTSQRFKSLRYGLHPFYRRSGVYSLRHPVQRTASLPSIDSRVVVSSERKFIFVRVPKCANTTLLTTLWLCAKGLGTEDLERYSADERKQLLRKQTMRHVFLSPSDLSSSQAYEALESYKTCIFVRNPFTRLASAYFYKIAKGRTAERLGLGPKPSFLHFCEFLRDDGLHADIHWMPQTHICPIPPERLHFVGRMENLVEDLDAMTQMLYQRSAPLLSRQHHATGADSRLRDLYGPEETEIVRNLYSDDFAAFGYSPEPF